MHPVDEVARPQHVRLAGARRAAAHVHGGDGAPFAQHDGAAGGGAPVRPVADAQAGDSGDGVEGQRFSTPADRPRGGAECDIR